jgi:hypothetical protein
MYAGRFAVNLERSLDYILQCSEKDQVFLPHRRLLLLLLT